MGTPFWYLTSHSLLYSSRAGLPCLGILCALTTTQMPRGFCYPSLRQTGEDNYVVLTSGGSALSNRIWNNNTLKQQIWLRTALCGGWCRRMVLRNLRVACQKWRRRLTELSLAILLWVGTISTGCGHSHHYGRYGEFCTIVGLLACWSWCWLLNVSAIWPMSLIYYTVFQKKPSLLMFDNNFGKCEPIFKILSPGDS